MFVVFVVFVVFVCVCVWLCLLAKVYFGTIAFQEVATWGWFGNGGNEVVEWEAVKEEEAMEVET